LNRTMMKRVSSGRRPYAPFQLVLIPINMHKSRRLLNAVQPFYDELIKAGIDVLLDDRKERPGVMFADAELIGIPHRFVYSERGLDAGTIEYKGRCDSDNMEIPMTDAIEFIRSRLDEAGMSPHVA